MMKQLAREAWRSGLDCWRTEGAVLPPRVHARGWTGSASVPMSCRKPSGGASPISRGQTAS